MKLNHDQVNGLGIGGAIILHYCIILYYYQGRGMIGYDRMNQVPEEERGINN